MSRLHSGLAAAALFALTSALALGGDGDVVVLKGGSVIPLREPWVRRGNTAFLTKPDGTILSVSVSEIDRDATDAARARAAAPPSPPADARAETPATPAAAAQAKSDVPKARVRITDSDVSHPMDLSDPAAGGPGKDDKDKKDLAPGAGRVEISTYDQKPEGNALIVSGKLRNPTQELVENVHLNVIVLDGKGEQIESGVAAVSNGDIDPGSEVDFKVKIPVGDKTPGSLRFAPTWNGPKPAPPAKGAKPARTSQAAAGAAKPGNP